MPVPRTIPSDAQTGEAPTFPALRSRQNDGRPGAGLLPRHAHADDRRRPSVRRCGEELEEPVRSRFGAAPVARESSGRAFFRCPGCPERAGGGGPVPERAGAFFVGPGAVRSDLLLRPPHRWGTPMSMGTRSVTSTARFAREGRPANNLGGHLGAFQYASPVGEKTRRKADELVEAPSVPARGGARRRNQGREALRFLSEGSPKDGAAMGGR